MFKTKAPSTRATYGAEFPICHSLYTADDITTTASAWGEWKLERECERLMPEKPWYEKPYPKGPAIGPVELPRALYPPSAGKGTFSGGDVTAFKRAISRAGRLKPWSPSTWNATYGEQFALGKGTGNVGDSGVRGFQRQEWPNDPAMQTGNLGDKTYQAIRRSLVADGPNKGRPLLDSVSVQLLDEAWVEQQEIVLCYPIAKGPQASVCQGLHQTAGLNGNWAMDFCAAGGSDVVAVEACKIVRLSGNDPAQGSDDEIGIFGWSIHYETVKSYRYFSTHYGSRTVSEGERVKAGTVIGRIGNWPDDPGRSHLHLGVTSPLGESDAKDRIEAVSQAVRV